MTATINALPANSDGGYYLSEYHIGPGKELGYWWGEPAKRLNLTEVTKSDFQRILHGVNPNSEKPLVKKHQDRVPALDLTFSVEKSVSAAWAMGGTELSNSIERCANAAIHETLQWMKENLPLVRRGKGGAEKEVGDFMAAIFKHETNRNGDPNLHFHCVIPNLVFDTNGRGSHIHSKKIFEYTRTLGPMFRASFARHLREETKLEISQADPVKGRFAGWFKLPGIPQALTDLWSSRKAEIDDFLIPKGLTRDSVSPQYRSQINTDTRKSKDRLPPLDVLYQRWGKEAKEHNFSRDDLRFNDSLESKRDIDRAFRKAYRGTVQHLERDRSHFNWKDLMQGVAERMQHCGIRVSDLHTKLIRKLEQDKTLVHLQGTAIDRTFTTQRIWREEERLLKDVENLRQKKGARVSDQTLSEVFNGRETISDEQRKAVFELTQTGGAIRLMRGVAGAGKTYTLDTVREAFEKDGYEVHGAAVSGLAKETLANDASIKSRTIASYLYQLTGRSTQGNEVPPTTPFHRKSVLVIDEASMVDLKGMRTLMQAVRRAKGTVILVGDDKQLQAIGSPGPFSYLLKRIRSSTLDQNRRQKHDEDKEAVHAIRHGNTKEALENYFQRGRLKISETRPKAAKELVQSWSKSGGTIAPENHSIFTQTRQEATYLNELCQNKRIAEGTLNRSTSTTLGESKFYSGDRVLFNKADRTLGIQNGHRGTIVSVDEARNVIKVRLDSQKSGLTPTVSVSLSRKMPGDIALGYAATTHKMQGQTAENAYILLGGGMTDNNMAYTQLTRAKNTTTLFIDSFSAGEELSSIARAMKRERTKSLAHEFIPQQHSANSHSL